MAFVRDHGTCCLVLPLKLGAGIITMVAFAHSIVCILALFTGDIRFQANGYNMAFFRLPSVVGAFGLITGFVGLLGIYDDKPLMIKIFNYWFAAKLLAIVVTILADYWALGKCDSWSSLKDHATWGNVQMDKLSEMRVCPWARWAYAIGSSIDVLVWAYLLWRSFVYQWQLELNPPYPIDFGREKYDKEARWRLYQVKDPRPDLPDRPAKGKEKSGGYYGSMEQLEQLEQLDLQHPGSQDLEAPYTYGPDGQRIPRPPAAGAPRPGQEGPGLGPAAGGNTAELIHM